jgi:hypothetical protein
MIFLVLLTVLFYSIASNGFDDLKYYLSAYPIIYFVPFLLVLSYLFMNRFKEEDNWDGSPAAAKSKMFYPAIALILVLAFATYFLYVNPDVQFSLAASQKEVKKETTPPVNMKNNQDRVLSQVGKEEPKPQETSADKNEPGSKIEPMEVTSVAAQTEYYEGTKEKASGETVETRYKTRSKTYFYSEPDEKARTKDFIQDWRDTYLPLNALQQKNGFVYVNVPTKKGEIKTGWLRRKDLKDISIVLQDSK